MNYLDIDGFDWFNPAPNTSIVSMMNLLNQAMFYRRINLNPQSYTLGKPTPYRQFEYFINIVNQCMDAHIFLNPLYIDVSLLNLQDRVDLIKLDEPFAQNSFLCVLATTIYNWDDLEEITGEDLAEFKDEKLRVNEVWSTRLLTKMYKIVSAFSVKVQSGGSHLIGDFINRDTYTDYSNGGTRYTSRGVSTTDFYQSYADGGYSISIDPDLAYDEFIDNLTIRQPKVITLTTQVNNGGTFGDPDSYPSSKYWSYLRYRNFIDGTNLARHRYEIRQACPLSPKFSRGNSTNYFQNQTQYYQYRQEKNIDDIEYYEYFYFYEKTNKNVDFGTGINLFDGGVLKYNHNEDSTLETDVFVNFDYINSNLAKDPNMSLDIPTYGAQDELSMESRTYADINNNPYNEYKTTSLEGS